MQAKNKLFSFRVLAYTVQVLARMNLSHAAQVTALSVYCSKQNQSSKAIVYAYSISYKLNRALFSIFFN